MEKSIDDTEIVRVRSLTEEKKNKRTNKKQEQQEKSKFDVALESLISANAVPCTNIDTEDEYFSFGKSLAFQLKKMTPVLAVEAMSEIQRISTDYRIKSLSQSQNVFKENPKSMEQKPQTQTKTNKMPQSQLQNQSGSERFMPYPHFKINKIAQHTNGNTASLNSINSTIPIKPKESIEEENSFEFAYSTEHTFEHTENSLSPSTSSHISFGSHIDEDENCSNSYKTNTILEQALFSDMFNE